MYKHKAIKIPDGSFQTNKKLFDMVNPKSACKLEFADHLWIPFLDQPQSDVVDFAILYFHIHIMLVTEWKHGIGPNYIITFNEELENLSTSNIELSNSDEYSHEETIVNFITKTYF